MEYADRRRISVPRLKLGQFPEMEVRLASRLRHFRELGMPVETWMVSMEAKMLLHDIFPEQFPKPKFDDSDETEFGFKCSRTWMDGFFSRKNFSRRALGKKMNKKGATTGMIDTTLDFHVNMRALQLSEINDPVYGLTSPYNLFTHDQVPIELCPKRQSTVDTRGVVEVYDATAKKTDDKRFCTLNLFGPMLLRDDLANLPKPHLVFSGKTKAGSEWADAEERALWDDSVVVSFQDNAWVDTTTHIYELKECLGPINEVLENEGNGTKGLVLEDNLSTHLTQRSLNYWRQHLVNFLPPYFLPVNMTDILQVCAHSHAELSLVFFVITLTALHYDS